MKPKQVTRLVLALQVIAAISIMLAVHATGVTVSQAVASARSHNDDEAPQKRRVASVMLGGALYVLVMVLGVIVVLMAVGVRAVSIAAVVGALGFAGGFAMQGVLQDVVSGLVIVAADIYRVGDIIQLDDFVGVVVDMDILHTTVREAKGTHQVMLPNRQVHASVLQNHTSHDTRGLALYVTVSNGVQAIEPILRATERALAEHPKVLPTPPPVAGVEEVTHLGTRVRAIVTIRSEDFGIKHNYDLHADLTAVMRDALRSQGVPLVQLGTLVGL